MSGAAILHRRQFVLAPSDTRPPVPPGWRRYPIGARALSACPELRVRTLRSERGRWLLLGNAVSTAPTDDLASAEPLDVADPVGASAAWAGRWLLIGEDEAVPDASAQLGLLYARGPDGTAWASSSLPLLRASLPGPGAVRDARRVRYETGISWFPPPWTRVAGIDRLLPSQRLRLDAAEVAPRRLLDPAAHGSPDAALDDAAARLARALTRLAARDGPLTLGLTAGADSRTLLAVAVAAGVPLRTYTRLHGGMSVADRLLPPQLAGMVERPHRYAVPPRTRPNRRVRTALLRDHAGGVVAAGDARPLIHGERDDVVGTVVGGRGFEVVSGFTPWRRLPRACPPPEEALRAVLTVTGEPRTSPAAEALLAYLTWADAHPEPGLDWRDRLYVESRMAGWIAAKEQASDALPADRMPVLNCAATYAAFLSCPEAARAGGAAQRAVIARTSPKLLELPFNPPDQAFALRAPHRVLQRAAIRRTGAVTRRLAARSEEWAARASARARTARRAATPPVTPGPRPEPDASERRG